MVEIADIEDRESLRGWLKEQPQEVSIWVAHRNAMRLLPLWWDFVLTSATAKKRDLTALPVLRCNLISSVARTMPTDDIKLAANAAYAAADAADAANAAAIWKLVRADCTAITSGDDLDRLPLWGDQENPLAKTWADVKQQLPTAHSDETARGVDAIDWSFWIKWYDDALAGKPPNWKMLERIALIDPAEWDKGAKRVNYLIGEIEKEFAVKATPYSEDIIYDGEYHAVPHSQLPANTLQDVQERLGDVIRYVRAAPDGNQYGPLLTEADYLEDVLERYPTRPIRIYEACEAVVAHVALDVANGALPENDKLVGDVVRDVQNSSDSIYNLDAEAAEAVDGWTNRRFERLSDEQKEAIVLIADAVAQNSDAELAPEMREDALAVQVEDDPEGEGKPKRYRLGSRLVRVLVLGGAGVGAVLGALAAVEPAVSGAQYLWQIIRPLIGF